MCRLSLNFIDFSASHIKCQKNSCLHYSYISNHDLKMWTFYWSRMHSSRMRTVRCSGRFLGEVSAREGCLPSGRGVCRGWGGVSPGVSAQWGLADTLLWTESHIGVKPLSYYVADGKHEGTLKLDTMANFYPRIASKRAQSSFSVNRSFCQICQNCIREKNSAKKLPLTRVEPLTLGLTVLLISCLSCLTPVLDPISWKTETLMILL